MKRLYLNNENTLFDQWEHYLINENTISSMRTLSHQWEYSIWPIKIYYLTNENTLFHQWEDFIWPMRILYFTNENTLFDQWEGSIWPMRRLSLTNKNTIFDQIEHPFWLMIEKINNQFRKYQFCLSFNNKFII